MSEEVSYDGVSLSAVGMFLGVQMSEWCKVKRLMDMHGFRTVDELICHIDEATAAQRRYEILVAGLREINKVLP